MLKKIKYTSSIVHFLEIKHYHSNLILLLNQFLTLVEIAMESKQEIWCKIKKGLQIRNELSSL